MKLRLNKCTVSFGDQIVLKDVDFEVKGRDRIAVTGRNGAGKTTLLGLIFGTIEADRDDFRKLPEREVSGDISVSMLSQTDETDGKVSVTQYVLGKDIFCEDMRETDANVRPDGRLTEFVKVLTGLGFKKEDMNRPLESFSGGERTRIRLLRTLLTKSDILLLDEPTNHLDIKSVEWLEKYLSGYPGAVIIVSHDRYFLDRTVKAVYDLENGRLTYYPGNYTAFREEKIRRNAAAVKAYERYNAELERLNSLIERFKNKPRKASFAASRKSLIARMEKVEKPAEYIAHIFTGEISPQKPGSRKVFTAEHLSFGYGAPLISNFSFEMQRGHKTAVLGANGAGKTTFFKNITGELQPLAGKISMGNGTDMGYFDQRSADITSSLTVLEYYSKHFPALDDKRIRTELAGYLFKGRDVIKKTDDLSGGERSRLILAQLLNEGHNFLLLDEPTNHMDVDARETLESAFEAYTGSILFVSHDRYFVNRVADSLLIFENGQAYYYPFGYEHYMLMKEKASAASEEEKPVCLGMMSAEDEAMIAGLKSVPRRERHELPFASAEEAGFDWSMRLADEALEKAFEEEKEALEYDSFCGAENRSTEKEALEYGSFCGAENGSTEKEALEYGSFFEAEYERAEKELSERERILTQACLDWYEIWQQGNPLL